MLAAEHLPPVPNEANDMNPSDDDEGLDLDGLQDGHGPQRPSDSSSTMPRKIVFVDDDDEGECSVCLVQIFAAHELILVIHLAEAVAKSLLSSTPQQQAILINTDFLPSTFVIH